MNELSNEETVDNKMVLLAGMCKLAGRKMFGLSLLRLQKESKSDMVSKKLLHI
jgi:hypothetical protein